MFSPFRRTRVGTACVAALAVLLCGCNREPSIAAAAGPGLPRLDLCSLIDQKTVAAVLGTAKQADCRIFGNAKTGYTVRFLSGTAALTISYAERFDLRTGDDRWQDDLAQGKRDALIGVGEEADYSATALPQLVARQGERVLGVAVEGAPPDQQLADELVPLATDILNRLKKR